MDTRPLDVDGPVIRVRGARFGAAYPVRCGAGDACAGAVREPMSVTIGLAGDTMLGRGVADAVARNGTRALFADEVRDAVARTDLFLLNLECCVSARGRRVE